MDYYNHYLNPYSYYPSSGCSTAPPREDRYEPEKKEKRGKKNQLKLLLCT